MPQLMEVLEYLDESGRTLVKRLPEDGECEIKWGAQLTVRESQTAIFFRDGHALDIFAPGRYILQTLNIPAVGKWVTRFGYGPTSPFRAEVYFVNMKLFPNWKWGTPEPIVFRDAELKMLRLRAHGVYSLQVSDPLLFLNKVVGTEGVYRDDRIGDYLRSVIVARVTAVLGQELRTVFDLPAQFEPLALAVRNALRLDFEGLGLALHDFYFNAITPTEDVQRLIDARSGMAAVGNLDDFMKFKAALAMETAAANAEGGAGTGVGVGAGMGLGFMLPNFLQQAVTGKQIAASGATAAEKIRSLKELLDMGAISREEYDAKKRELLEEI